MSYDVELAQPNFKSYKVITIFMAFLNAVSFIFYFLNADIAFLKVVSSILLKLKYAIFNYIFFFQSLINTVRL